MYFPLLKPHSQGKKSAVQPKPIYSEFPMGSSGGEKKDCIESLPLVY